MTRVLMFSGVVFLALVILFLLIDMTAASKVLIAGRVTQVSSAGWRYDQVDVATSYRERPFAFTVGAGLVSAGQEVRVRCGRGIFPGSCYNPVMVHDWAD